MGFHVGNGKKRRKHLLIFGNPLVGKPIAAEHINTLPITSKFGCGSLIPWPTFCTSGSTINAATVWLMNVATTNISVANTTSTLYRLNPPTLSVMVWAIV